MKANIILTKELRNRVDDRINWCIKKANEKYEVEIKKPDVFFDIHSTTGGLAYRNVNKVRFNLIMLHENTDHFIEHTVAHELAHIVVNQVHRPKAIEAGRKKVLAHGKEWREVMTDCFKLPADVRHHYPIDSIDRQTRSKKRSQKSRVDQIVWLVDLIQKKIDRMSEDEKFELRGQVNLTHLLD